MKSDKVSLVDFGTYTKLNESLSKAEGWKIENDKAERIWPVNPELAKVNRTFDTETGEELSYDQMCVAPISAKIQERYPELFESLELINWWDVVPAEDELDILETENLTTHTVDWLLRHYDLVGRKEEELVLWLGSEAPSPELESVIKNLTDAGLTVSVIDNTTV